MKITQNTVTGLRPFNMQLMHYLCCIFRTLYFQAFLSIYGFTSQQSISLTVYGAAVLEHCLMEEGFPENAKIGKGFNLEEG